MDCFIKARRRDDVKKCGQDTISPECSTCRGVVVNGESMYDSPTVAKLPCRLIHAAAAIRGRGI